MANTISPKTNKIINVVISLGAAVVILGALTKLINLPGADWLLVIGLTTEAIIFVIYAFLPPPDMGSSSTGVGIGATESVVSSMEAAKLDEAAFKKLSSSFEKLNDTAMHLGDLADMAKSSKDFTNNIKDAAISLGTVKDSVASVANNLGSFASASDGVKNLNEQFVTMTKTMEAMNNYYGKLSEASNAMSSSAADAVRAKEQIALLADNLTKLNQIYSNMLSAMQGR
ncbi:MAG: GldL-related protein [Chitinophagaceae bacterium]|jgi:uncharacterized phage infection (PIP) family protein YhgE|nr:hypothetical protein [Sediminibacterium sp.]